ncbi:unnamed protein product [Trichobilharzia regenti]|nr:unnamed protein product [Trichobilharzia regenti]
MVRLHLNRMKTKHYLFNGIKIDPHVLLMLNSKPKMMILKVSIKQCALNDATLIAWFEI